MKTFEYKGISRDGQRRRGLVEAGSAKEARSRLAGGGILAEDVRPVGAGRGLSRELRATLYRELSALLVAGVPLARALDLLVSSPDVRRGASAVAGVRDGVKEGRPLAVAVSETIPGVSEFERAMIEAGERSATLDALLGRLGTVMEEQERIRERVRTALIYPALVLAVGTCVVIVMMEVLIPRIETLVRSSGHALPLLTRIVISFSRAVPVVLPVVLLLAGSGAVLMAWRRKRDPEFRQKVDRFLFRLPVIGGAYAVLARARFARTLSVLVAGGVPLVESLALAGRATGSAWLDACVTAESARVREGSRLSDAVRRIGPLGEGLPDWIGIGEETGDLAGSLASAAARFQEGWDRSLTRALAVMEPVFVIFLGAFVLVVTLAVVLPIMSLTSTIR